MTDTDQFRRNLGRELAAVREKRGWDNAHAMYVASGKKLHYQIIQKHEQGVFLSISSMDEHVRILGVAAVDVIRTALALSVQSLSPTAMALGRVFDRLHPSKQRLLTELAASLAGGEGVPPISAASATGQKKTRARTKRAHASGEPKER